MWWIFFVVIICGGAYSGYRQAKRAGLWSWSKFAFSVGFALFDGALITAPVIFIDMNSPYFVPVYVASWVLAAVFFGWFIIKARKWKLPDGRTSLEADREQRR